MSQKRKGVCIGNREWPLLTGTWTFRRHGVIAGRPGFALIHDSSSWRRKGAGRVFAWQGSADPGRRVTQDGVRPETCTLRPKKWIRGPFGRWLMILHLGARTGQARRVFDACRE